MIVFFFNDTATTEIYPLSLHDALPIYSRTAKFSPEPIAISAAEKDSPRIHGPFASAASSTRSEEHTSELQSLTNLVCRLLLEKKKIGDNQLSNERVQKPDNRLYEF